MAALTAMLVFASAQMATAQDECDNRKFLDRTASFLKEYRFLKAFKLETDDAQQQNDNSVKYRVVLSKDTRYKIITNSSGGKLREPVLVAKLYGPGNQQIASSYDEQKKRHYTVVGYKCNATGIYTIEYSFKGKGEGCGVSILGFQRPFNQ
jgi:hypothetical protein